MDSLEVNWKYHIVPGSRPPITLPTMAVASCSRFGSSSKARLAAVTSLWISRPTRLTPAVRSDGGITPQSVSVDSKPTAPIRKKSEGTLMFVSSCWPRRGHMGSELSCIGISNPAWNLPKIRFQELFRRQWVPCAPVQPTLLNCNSALTQSQQPVYRTANQVWPTLRVSSSTLDIQALAELNVAWLQWSYENWNTFFKHPGHKLILSYAQTLLLKFVLNSSIARAQDV